MVIGIGYGAQVKSHHLLLDLTTGDDHSQYINLAPPSSLRNVITPTGDFIPITLVGSSSQTQPLWKARNNSNTAYSQINADGSLTIQGAQSVATLGAELLTDGDFATDPTGAWTFSGGWSWNSGTKLMAFAGAAGAIAAVAINFGGTGYTVNDVITLTNGANDATLTVTSVSSGAITGVSITNAGTACTVNASVNVTGGTGSGAQVQIIRLADSTAVLSQLPAIVIGAIYKIVYTISGLSNGEINVTLGGVNGSRVNANGTFTQIITTSDTTGLIFTPTQNFVGNIDTISLVQVTPVSASSSHLNSDGSIGIELRPGGAALSNAYGGNFAGQLTISGSGNAAWGVGAAASLLSASNDIAMGNLALNKNATAAALLAVGTNALRDHISGGNLVAVGRNALQSDIKGTDNTALGDSTLQFNLFGTGNTAGGSQALRQLINGNNNAAWGLNSLTSLINGSGNVSSGTNSLNSLISGSNNVVAGFGVASALKTGGSNVILGNSAAAGLKTGSSCVIIGSNAGGLETGSNRLNIHNSSTDIPLIWGDFSSLLLATSGKLGIITKNPQAAADFVGADTTSSAFAQKWKNTGAELITATADRDFSGANNWTGTNWSTSGGVFLHTAGSTADAVLANANLTASQVFSSGVYKVVFTVASCTAGSVTAKLGTGAGGARSINGTFTEFLIASGANVNLIFTPTSDFNGSIDNISVKRLAEIGSVANNGQALFTGQDNGTNAALGVLTVRHQTSGTPAAGFGSTLLMDGDSAGTGGNGNTTRSQFSIDATWATATDGSRKARAVLSVFDTAVREAIRFEASGTAAMIGAYGNAAVVRPAAYTQTYTTTSRTVPAYTTNSQSGAYSGIATGVGGTPYAQLTDLNALRTAYENLRASYDALLNVVTQVIDDLQLEGWLQ